MLQLLAYPSGRSQVPSTAPKPTIRGGIMSFSLSVRPCSRTPPIHSHKSPHMTMLYASKLPSFFPACSVRNFVLYDSNLISALASSRVSSFGFAFSLIETMRFPPMLVTLPVSLWLWCSASISSPPPILLPLMSTFGTVLRPVLRASDCWRPGPSSCWSSSTT